MHYDIIQKFKEYFNDTQYLKEVLHSMIQCLFSKNKTNSIDIIIADKSQYKIIEIQIISI